MAETRISLSLLPAIGGAGAGILAAACLALLPAADLEAVVDLSGLPMLLAAAEPPLGMTARVLLAVAGCVFASATAWAALFLLFGPGGTFAREGREDGMPAVRRADAHPDAPPRRPLSAADLSAADLRAPPPPVQRELPRDLDQPLAAFDPAAIPAEPLAPVRPVAPLHPKFAPGERISSVELPVRRAFDAAAPSIDALLSRLERGTMRHRELRRAV